MKTRVHGWLCVAGVALCVMPVCLHAQVRRSYGALQPDSLIAVGRWSEAEDALYSRSRAHPRDPVARAALGRYLAMKGAVRAGHVLIEEAIRFGLDAARGREMLRPLDEVLRWRDTTARKPSSDSLTLPVRLPRDTTALFAMPLDACDVRVATRDSSWVDVMPAILSMEPRTASTHGIGIQTIEAQVPAVDMRARRLTLFLDGRTALRAIGQRYPVLRDERGIRVLLGPGRVLPIASALRELDVRWWQLDLPHGLLVVR